MTHSSREHHGHEHHWYRRYSVNIKSVTCRIRVKMVPLICLVMTWWLNYTSPVGHRYVSGILWHRGNFHLTTSLIMWRRIQNVLKENSHDLPKCRRLLCNLILVARKIRKWNNLKCQLDATRLIYSCILSSTCFRYIRLSSGALDVELQHMVFRTEFLDGWWSWELMRRSCVRWVTATSAPHTRPTQRLSRPPRIQKFGAEKRMLQLNI